MRLIKSLLKSLRQNGIRDTFKNAVWTYDDYKFDWKFGTDTMQRVDVESFETDSDNKAHARFYQASKTRPVLELFNKLCLPKDSVFVDMGCGKGRVLLLAAQRGFKKVVGIEFCAQLYRQSLKNVEIYVKKYPASPLIEVIKLDVTYYPFKKDENILFLYNPFDSVVLVRVLQNISDSLQKAPREIWLIYNNPVLHEIVQNSGLFHHYKQYEIEGELFRVYHHLHAKP